MLRPHGGKLLATLFLSIAVLSVACASVRNPEGWAPPVVTADRILLFQTKEQLSSISTKAPLPAITWEYPADALKNKKGIKLQAVYGEPLVEDGRIFVATYEGDVIALNESDGSELWRRSGLHGGIIGQLNSAGNALVFGTIDGRLWSIDKANGATTTTWPPKGIDLPDGIWAPVAIEGDTGYVATIGGQLFAFDLATGEFRWPRSFEVSAAIADLALVGPGRLFVPSLSKNVYIVDTATGAAIGPPAKASDWVWMQPAVRGGQAYFGDFSGRIFALDITTGKGRLLGELPAKLKSTPALIGDTLVIADRDRNVAFFDTRDGKKLNTVPVGEKGTIRAALKVANGFVYVATTKGTLFKADPKELSVVEVLLPGASK
jgi:outer membrane protein assembly factor BamB